MPFSNSEIIFEEKLISEYVSKVAWYPDNLPNGGR